MDAVVGEFQIGSNASNASDSGATADVLRLLLGDAFDAGQTAQEAALVEFLGGGKGVKEVAGQPAQLALEGRQLRENIESVAYENYSSFLQTATCIGRTRMAVNETKVHLGSLLHDLPKLAAACNDFTACAERVGEKRALDQLTMQHYPQLLELLEVPQLMESCVKGRLYEPALQLHAFVRRAQQSHPNVPLLSDMVRDVGHWALIMQQQLMELLASDCDTDTTIRAVDHLRRLDAECDETALRLRFLKAREAWMEAGASAIPSGQVPRWLIGRAERLRVDLFYVVTQYHTLFGGAGAGGDSSHALWWFAFSKIDEFVRLLDARLPSIHEGEDLAAVMDAALYCGSALARVGLDFRVKALPLFEQSVERMFSRKLEVALHFFSEALQSHNWRLAPDASSVSAGAPTSTSDAQTPPASLLQHPPLALLCNDMLEALNHLRVIAMLSLKERSSDMLRRTLAEAGALLGAHAARSNAKGSSAVFADMRREMQDHLVPHLTQALDWIYGKDPVAATVVLDEQPAPLASDW